MNYIINLGSLGHALDSELLVKIVHTFRLELIAQYFGLQKFILDIKTIIKNM